VIVVIKIGGAALEDAAILRKSARAIAELAQDGHRVAVVHGGGSALTRVLSNWERRVNLSAACVSPTRRRVTWR